MLFVLRTNNIYKPIKNYFKMDIATALSIILRELNQPVISDYELCANIFNLYQTKKYKGEIIRNANRIRSFQSVGKTIVTPLIESGILSNDKDFAKGKVFQIMGNKHLEAGEIVCTTDPFAYISHLSAMEYHGLTNRLPKMLFMSSPPPKDWTRFASQKMMKDIGQDLLDVYLRHGYPRLSNLRCSKVQNTFINKYSSIHQGAFKKIEGRKLRVSTIGRTFLDMLRTPDYCGGMNHVMEIFTLYGKQYKNLIIDEIDRHGNLMERTRAGYLLEERAGVHDQKIDKWASQVERGGSRKLNPAGGYSENYSPRWWLSLNVS